MCIRDRDSAVYCGNGQSKNCQKADAVSPATMWNLYRFDAQGKYTGYKNSAGFDGIFKNRHPECVIDDALPKPGGFAGNELRGYAVRYPELRGANPYNREAGSGARKQRARAGGARTLKARKAPKKTAAGQPAVKRPATGGKNSPKALARPPPLTARLAALKKRVHP